MFGSSPHDDDLVRSESSVENDLEVIGGTATPIAGNQYVSSPDGYAVESEPD